MGSTDILLVIEGTYPWYRGGVSEWVHQYMKACHNQRFHILQVATDQYLNAPVSEALYEVPEHLHSFCRIPPPSLKKNWLDESQQWKKSVEEKTKQIVSKCDLVHIANTGFAGWLGKEVAVDTGKPLLLTEHALYWKEIDMGAVALECGYKIPDREQLKNEYTEMFKKMAEGIYKVADQVVSVSECNMEEQHRMGATNVQYIPNGIPGNWIKKEKEYQGDLTVGWIGRCAEMKNPLKFFSLADAARKMGVDGIEFMMLSCDANEPKLADAVHKKSKEYPELRLVWNKSTVEYIDKMDALCITSHNESQPLVLFEALARKVLPIGWKAGDVTNRYGIIKNKDESTKGLLNSVLSAWNNPFYWRKIVNEKSLLVAENHRWEHIFNRYRTIFDQLLKGCSVYND
ncbi:DUF3492 domain-containing protein [Fodinibius saliphilus]|uniref:DUF3492 domain-containing protein n=1 Tax=Fodinibius saliphilus TaxID=1920650 RepID=UPI001108B701|nr:DUF3492 domain-containing protein [Fodinibius saliphilus]